jgi:hypothetical protein
VTHELAGAAHGGYRLTGGQQAAHDDGLGSWLPARGSDTTVRSAARLTPAVPRHLGLLALPSMRGPQRDRPLLPVPPPGPQAETATRLA